MVKQQQFEQSHQPFWSRFEVLLDELEASAGKRAPWRKKQQQHTEPTDLHRFPADYRRLCAHYAMALERRYSSALIAHLHTMVMRGQACLYRRPERWLWTGVQFLMNGLPSVIRRHSRVLLVASLLFWLPAIVLGFVCYQLPDTIFMVSDSVSVAQYESMYDPASDHLGRRQERAADSRFAMFGFYIWNNVSIGFRTFAAGLLFGLGTIFFLIYNGIQIGSVAGYLSWRGYIETFWGFVAGHSAFELSAICICGAAGLVLGQALWIPGTKSRLHALQEAAKDAVQLMIGGMLMLFMAAFIEAYWSPLRSVPAMTKYLVGLSFWVLLLMYLWYARSWHERR